MFGISKRTLFIRYSGFVFLLLIGTWLFFEIVAFKLVSNYGSELDAFTSQFLVCAISIGLSFVCLGGGAMFVTSIKLLPRLKGFSDNKNFLVLLDHYLPSFIVVIGLSFLLIALNIVY